LRARRGRGRASPPRTPRAGRRWRRASAVRRWRRRRGGPARAARPAPGSCRLRRWPVPAPVRRRAMAAVLAASSPRRSLFFSPLRRLYAQPPLPVAPCLCAWHGRALVSSLIPWSLPVCAALFRLPPSHDPQSGRRLDALPCFVPSPRPPLQHACDLTRPRPLRIALCEEVRPPLGNTNAAPTGVGEKQGGLRWAGGCVSANTQTRHSLVVWRQGSAAKARANLHYSAARVRVQAPGKGPTGQREGSNAVEVTAAIAGVALLVTSNRLFTPAYKQLQNLTHEPTGAPGARPSTADRSAAGRRPAASSLGSAASGSEWPGPAAGPGDWLKASAPGGEGLGPGAGGRGWDGADAGRRQRCRSEGRGAGAWDVKLASPRAFFFGARQTPRGRPGTAMPGEGDATRAVAHPGRRQPAEALAAVAGCAGGGVGVRAHAGGGVAAGCLQVARACRSRDMQNLGHKYGAESAWVSRTLRMPCPSGPATAGTLSVPCLPTGPRSCAPASPPLETARVCKKLAGS
jgi:hypothetical protein